MSTNTARRIDAYTLSLRGDALDAVMQMAASPYDLHHPHHQAASMVFTPAREYIKTLGHLTRAYLNPEGWVREAAFEMELRELIIGSENPSVLDKLELLLGRLRDHAGEPRYPFHYRHGSDEDNLAYDPKSIVPVFPKQIEKILGFDRDNSASRQILSKHQGFIDEGFRYFLAHRLDESLVIQKLDYEITLIGFAYDTAVQTYPQKRSQAEIAEIVSEGHNPFARLFKSKADLAPFTPLPQILDEETPTPATTSPRVETREIETVLPTEIDFTESRPNPFTPEPRVVRAAESLDLANDPRLSRPVRFGDWDATEELPLSPLPTAGFKYPMEEDLASSPVEDEFDLVGPPASRAPLADPNLINRTENSQKVSLRTAKLTHNTKKVSRPEGDPLEFLQDR
jgi:hypothetical protein